VNPGKPVRRIRLGTILALLLLVTIVPLGLFAGQLVLTSRQQQQDLVNRQNVERARAISVAVDKEVQSTITALRALAALGRLDAANLRPFYDAATAMLRLQPGWQAVRLVDPGARVLMNTGVPLGEPSALVNDDWVRAVRDTRRPAVSVVRQDPSTGQYFVSIGVPVLERDRVRFALGARILASELSAVLQRQQAPEGGVVALMDAELTIMARTRGEDVYLGDKPSADFAVAIMSAPEGAIRSRLLEGTPSFSAWSRSELTRWTVGLGLPAAAVDGPILRSLALLVAVGVTILGGGLLLAFLVRWRVVRAQVAAVAAARALARGEPTAPWGSRVTEFNDLAEGLRDAGAILEQRLKERDDAERERARAASELERALGREHAARVAGERNEARLLVTLRSIGDAVIATDASGRITMLNPVAQALTGWNETEAIGSRIETVFVTLDERTRRPNPGPLARIAATGGGHTLPSKAILVARDGREIPIGDSASPIQTGDGSLLGLVVVFRDTTAERDAERHRAAALEREQTARRTAEALSRAKDEFVATVSHELRTPLNAIFGWVAMLRIGALDAEGQAKALAVIERNTRVQAQLIEDLLDMARVIRGTVRLEMLPVDLAAVVESAADAVKPAADARRVTLRVHAPRGVAFVSGDASRLQQISMNLLSNAIKFSNAGGDVDVTLETPGDDALLRVRDTGAGIDPAFLPHVFERFRRHPRACGARPRALARPPPRRAARRLGVGGKHRQVAGLDVHGAAAAHRRTGGATGHARRPRQRTGAGGGGLHAARPLRAGRRRRPRRARTRDDRPPAGGRGGRCRAVGARGHLGHRRARTRRRHRRHRDAPGHRLRSRAAAPRDTVLERDPRHRADRVRPRRRPRRGALARIHRPPRQAVLAARARRDRGGGGAEVALSCQLSAVRRP